MKTIFKLAVVTVVALVSGSTFAQDKKSSATTNLNVNLADIYELTVNDPSVNIDMNTVEHFQHGNTSGELANHVQVTATQKYEVKVVASSDLTNNGITIPVNTVEVRVKGNTNLAKGSAPANFTATHNVAALNTTESNAIITTTSGSAKMGYAIEYAIPAEQTAAYTDKAEGTYSTTVTYNLYAL
ncbi:hypothetical protein [Myroides pelagicus]|uniref:DUF4402 domain-containing protein n=1 Tax=Myroides pelagicus TaxID=270914 RepID=A0A7K1GQD7_9FLAO|nr:hypothetical protein [Myroides pelagicus]MTH30988.1 hypothetical protein [Myroides pelagicus]